MTLVVNENEVQKQIENMTALIDLEANEKVEEIEAKTEEEFQIEKNKIVQEQRNKIEDYYKKKENQVTVAKHIQNSNMMNNAKLKILAAKQDHIKKLLEASKNKLNLISKDQGIYRETLKQLISQSLFQLLEKEVIIRCHLKDIEIVNQVLPQAIDHYHKITNNTVHATIDRETFINNVMGGIEVSTPNDKIRVVNTLDSRLELLSNQMIPELREILFGTNVNRKFAD